AARSLDRRGPGSGGSGGEARRRRRTGARAALRRGRDRADAAASARRGAPARAAACPRRRPRSLDALLAPCAPRPAQRASPARSRWASTATAEFENSVVTVSALGQAPALVGPEQGDRVAERLSRFLERRGALDSVMAERLLLPAVLCAGGLGARAGTPPSC